MFDELVLNSKLEHQQPVANWSVNKEAGQTQLAWGGRGRGIGRLAQFVTNIHIHIRICKYQSKDSSSYSYSPFFVNLNLFVFVFTLLFNSNIFVLIFALFCYIILYFTNYFKPNKIYYILWHI